MYEKNTKSLNSKGSLETLDDKYVVKTNENYRGFSYGDVIIRWQRWLLSDKPDRNQPHDILFLRGSVGHHQSVSHYFSASVEIPEHTAILVPIVTTFYHFGNSYKSRVIQDEFYLRKSVREHVDAAGPFWATMELNNKIVVRLVTNLLEFRVESMIFELDVSEKNPFLDKADEPIFPGRQKGLVAGYFVLLRNLPSGSYKLRFGGYGMDKFFTESLYQIDIIPGNVVRKDISGSKWAPSHLRHEKKTAIRTKLRFSN